MIQDKEVISGNDGMIKFLSMTGIINHMPEQIAGCRYKEMSCKKHLTTCKHTVTTKNIFLTDQ